MRATPASFRQRVTLVQRRARTARDRHGNTDLVISRRIPNVRARVTARSSSEVLDDRDNVATRYTVFLLPDVDLTAVDELELDGGTRLRITGAPRPVYGSVRLHHYELDAEAITG